MGFPLPITWNPFLSRRLAVATLAGCLVLISWERQMRRLSFPFIVGALASAIACADQTPVAPRVAGTAQASKTSMPSFGPWAKVIQGNTGPGSSYALYIPASWNGDAVYFAHGIRAPQDEISIDINQDNFFAVRDALGTMGYAFAYSSFSENGLAIKDGAQRTHQLRGLLASELPSPAKRNFLTGYSLGALIGVDLAEQHPDEYDGLLAMCGMVGGTPHELQFIGDVRALFDYFYPGVLPGNVITPPSSVPTLLQVQAMVVGAIASNPLGLFAIASTAQTPLGWAPIGNPTDPSSPAFQSMAQSLVAALYYQLVGTQDVLDRTHGHSPYDNGGVTYSLGTAVVPPLAPVLSAMIAGANAGVTRYATTPDARNYLENYYLPTGRLQFPVVSVHNLWDYLVPYSHEPVYAGIVNAAGKSGLLLQRAIPFYGHCQFETSVVLGSFQSLVDWVNTGVKPAQ